MREPERDLADPARLRQQALSRWDNEGGASAQCPHDGPSAGEVISNHRPDVTNSELVLLRVRLIALENLVIAVLAGASELQLEFAHDATAYISPRPGFTVHRLTARASTHMDDLVERAAVFRDHTVAEAKAYYPAGSSDRPFLPMPVLSRFRDWLA